MRLKWRGYVRGVERWVLWFAALVLCLYATLVAVVVVEDLWSDGRYYAGFASRPNWLLYPLWIALAVPLVHITWRPFLGAWLSLAKRNLVRERVHVPNEGRALRSSEVARRVFPKLHQWRRRAILLCCTLVPVLVTLDASDVYASLDGYRAHVCIPGCPREIDSEGVCRCPPWNPHCSRGGPAARHCPKDQRDYCRCPALGPAAERCFNAWSASCECDFFAAHLVGGPQDRSASVWRAALLAYSMQAMVGFLVGLSLLQILIHTLAFWLHKHLLDRRYPRLELALDPYSPCNEFGLEHWNQALNNTYWILSAAMIGAIASRSAQDGIGHDLGQHMLDALVVPLIASPMLVSIVSRQGMLERTWRKVRKDCHLAGDAGQGAWDDHKAALLDRFHAQRVWPLTENWSSKMGLVLAFALLSIFLGIRVTDLFGL